MDEATPTGGRRLKLLYLIAEDRYFWSHRLSLARAAMERGFDVTVATRVTTYGDRIRAEGFAVQPISLQRHGYNPWREAKAIAELVRLYRRERPWLVHQFGLKPVLSGSVAALAARVPNIVNTLTGMGYLFTSQNRTARLLRSPVRIALRLLFARHGCWVILQNPDDYWSLQCAGVIDPQRTTLIKGSGVDVHVFKPVSKPEGRLVVALVSRMLWDKGVREFVEAAHLLGLNGVDARFALVGEPDSDNPTSVPASWLRDQHEKGTVEWWGYRNDMPEVWGQVHIAAFPSSYGEGVPKVLLEAAACGLPIVTTDSSGCRETVRDGVNGFLVPARDSAALAAALRRLIEEASLRRRMGAASRALADSDFSDERIIEQTLAVYQKVLGRKDLSAEVPSVATGMRSP